MQQHDGVALSHLHIRHLAAENLPPLFLVRKYCRDHVRFSPNANVHSGRGESLICRNKPLFCFCNVRPPRNEGLRNQPGQHRPRLGELRHYPKSRSTGSLAHISANPSSVRNGLMSGRSSRKQEPPFLCRFDQFVKLECPVFAQTRRPYPSGVGVEADVADHCLRRLHCADSGHLAPDFCAWPR